MEMSAAITVIALGLTIFMHVHLRGQRLSDIGSGEEDDETLDKVDESTINKSEQNTEAL